MGKLKNAVHDEICEMEPVDTPDPPEPDVADHPANVLLVPLSKLDIDVTNVRYNTNPDADDEMFKLIASIEHVGLLQPLAVVQRGERYGVVAGRRRWVALTTIYHEKQPHRLVECVEVPEHMAVEASLAENYVRRQMSTAELYQGFKKMGTDDPDVIASAFGLPIERVKRIMRLSGLAEPIMAAWSAGEITDQKAQAYASTADKDVQTLVFEKANSWDSHVDIRRSIRELISGNIDLRLLRFVGQQIYVDAGGRFEADLFTDEITPLDGPLLERLVDEKMACYRTEWEHGTRRQDGGDLNVEWVDERLPYNWQLNVKLDIVHADEAAATRATEIETMLDDYEQELGEMNLEADNEFDELGKLTEHAKQWIAEENPLSDEQIERAEELAGLILPLYLEKDKLEENLVRQIPEGKGKVLIHAEINGNQVSIAMQYASLEDAGITPPDLASEAEKAATPLESAPNVGLTQRAEQVLKGMRADAIRRNVYDLDEGGEKAKDAHDALIFTIARGMAGNGSSEWQNGMVSSAAGSSYHNYDYKSRARLIEADWLTGDDLVTCFQTFRSLPEIEKDRVAAELFTRKVNGQLYEAEERNVPNYLNTVLAHGYVARRVIDLDEEFFALFRKGQIVDFFADALKEKMSDTLRAKLNKAKQDSIREYALHCFNPDDHPSTVKLLGLTPHIKLLRDWVPKWLRFDPFEVFQVLPPPPPAKEKKPRAKKEKKDAGTTE